MDFVLIVAGFALLFVGAEGLVRGSVRIAHHFGISPLLIGLTLVGFGTSSPELVTTLEAALAGSPGLAIGNVVGSNIANILLILGVAAIISPFGCDRRVIWRDGVALAVATLALLAAALTGTIGRIEGFLMVAALIGYIVYAYRSERKPAAGPDADRAHDAAEDAAVLAGHPPKSLRIAAIYAAGGLAVTVLGAKLLVTGAIGIATQFGISDTIIGLTVVAVGTSLPELATSVVAAMRRQADIALGNIVGSNIYNVLGILGITSLVTPVPVPPEVLRTDVWVMLAATVLFFIFVRTGWRLTRSEGGVFLAGYAAYIAWLGFQAT